MGMSKSEAGKLGASKSKEIIEQLFQKRKNDYELTPVTCRYCSAKLEYKNRNRVFCNKSCSASFNNIKRGKTFSECVVCSKQIAKRGKFCGNKCQKVYEYKQRIDNWSDCPPGKGVIKRFLSEKFGNQCSVCGLTEWNNKEIVLELEHIDGNSSNNAMENVCLICPNCHSQTSTFKGKNRGMVARFGALDMQKEKVFKTNIMLKLQIQFNYLLWDFQKMIFRRKLYWVVGRGIS